MVEGQSFQKFSMTKPRVTKMRVTKPCVKDLCACVTRVACDKVACDKAVRVRELRVTKLCACVTMSCVWQRRVGERSCMCERCARKIVSDKVDLSGWPIVKANFQLLFIGFIAWIDGKVCRKPYFTESKYHNQIWIPWQTDVPSTIYPVPK